MDPSTRSFWLTTPRTRRSVLRGAAAAGAAALVAPFLGTLTACSDDVTTPNDHITIDPSTEAGALNFAYALSQLEADFYARIVPNMYPGMLTSEAQAFQGYGFDQQGQSSTFLTAIPSGRIGDELTFRFFELVNFADRSSVISTARTIAETALRGYASAETHVTTQAALMTSAVSHAMTRATTIRAMDGVFDPPDDSPLDAGAVFGILGTYYQTSITVRSA